MNKFTLAGRWNVPNLASLLTSLEILITGGYSLTQRLVDDHTHLYEFEIRQTQNKNLEKTKNIATVFASKTRKYNNFLAVLESKELNTKEDKINQQEEDYKDYEIENNMSINFKVTQSTNALILNRSFSIQR